MANPTPPQLDQFLAAVRSVESGGNYDEPNGQGAYQILQSNWPTWALRYAGYRTSDPNASDAPPIVQDEVATGAVEADYYGAGQRSWRKVARIWNGGSPDPVPNPALGPGATTDDYADRVLAAMGKAVPSGNGGAAVTGDPATGDGGTLTGNDWITALDSALNPDVGGLSLNPLKDAGDIAKTVEMLGVRVSLALVGMTLFGAGLLLAFGRDIFARTPVGEAAEAVADAVPVDKPTHERITDKIEGPAYVEMAEAQDKNERREAA